MAEIEINEHTDLKVARQQLETEHARLNQQLQALATEEQRWQRAKVTDQQQQKIEQFRERKVAYDELRKRLDAAKDELINAEREAARHEPKLRYSGEYDRARDARRRAIELVNNLEMEVQIAGSELARMRQELPRDCPERQDDRTQTMGVASYGSSAGGFAPQTA